MTKEAKNSHLARGLQKKIADYLMKHSVDIDRGIDILSVIYLDLLNHRYSGSNKDIQNNLDGLKSCFNGVFGEFLNDKQETL